MIHGDSNSATFAAPVLFGHVADPPAQPRPPIGAARLLDRVLGEEHGTDQTSSSSRSRIRWLTTRLEPPGGHRDAVEDVGRLHRALLVRDDQQLRLVAELVHEIEEPVQVHVVERGLDLVHQIEGRRPGAEHREEVRQRGERTLTTGEQREAAHHLPGRARFHLDARVQHVVRLGEHEPAAAAGEQHREQLVEVAGDVGERRLEHRHDLLVDGLDHARQLSARVLHVVELLLQEFVALDERLVLRERERVDRAHEAQLAFELTRACREGDAFGALGHGRGERGVGFAVELLADPLDGLFEPHAELGLFDLEAADALAQLGELLLRFGAFAAQSVEAAAGFARRVGLLLPAPAEPVGELLDGRRLCDETFGDRGRGLTAPFELGTPGPGLGLFVGPRREPGLDGCEPLPQHGAPLLDRRAPYLVVLTQTRRRSRGGGRARCVARVPRRRRARSRRRARAPGRASREARSLRLRGCRPSGAASSAAPPATRCGPRRRGAAARRGP